MIEGKLAENHEPKNVGPNRRALIRLRDEQGVIPEVFPEEEESFERASSSSEAGGGKQDRGESPIEMEIGGHSHGSDEHTRPDPELAVELAFPHARIRD